MHATPEDAIKSQGHLESGWSMQLGCKGTVLMQLTTEEIKEMEKEEAWVPTDRVPVIDEDITEACL